MALVEAVVLGQLFVLGISSNKSIFLDIFSVEDFLANFSFDANMLLASIKINALQGFPSENVCSEFVTTNVHKFYKSKMTCISDEGYVVYIL